MRSKPRHPRWPSNEYASFQPSRADQSEALWAQETAEETAGFIFLTSPMLLKWQSSGLAISCTESAKIRFKCSTTADHHDNQQPHQHGQQVCYLLVG
jgi:hypothetical protein